MSHLSPRKLRNGKLLSQRSFNQADNSLSESSTLIMENGNNVESEILRTRSPSPQNHKETQRKNEERFNMLQTEMSSLRL